MILNLTQPLPGRYLTPFSKTYWHTAREGDIQIAFMETSHLFNCFRMIYDMIAAREGWPVMRRAGEQARQMSNEHAAKLMANLAHEIECRADLDSFRSGEFCLMLGFCTRTKGTKEIECKEQSR